MDTGLGRCFRISNAELAIEVMEYGARLTSCVMRGRDGSPVDVVPGMDTPELYLRHGGTMGAVLGRYGNRLENGRITLDGKIYELARNDGAHTMHGGPRNFGTRRWTGEQLAPERLRLTLESEDGDQGWPGRVWAEVDYVLDGCSLAVDIRAEVDRPTYLNMIFHGYWNLGGHGSGSVGDHILRVSAENYLPLTEARVPTGTVKSVAGTDIDFRAERMIGHPAGGYNHTLKLDAYRPGGERVVARLLEPRSGRSLEMSTDQPSLQLYTAGGWSGVPGKDGASYSAGDALALECQMYPNAPNTPSLGPAPIVTPQAGYRHRMTFRLRSLEQVAYRQFLGCDW